MALATAASLLELGPVCALLREGQGVTAVLACGLSYQIGNAVAGRLPLSRTVSALTGIAGAFALCLQPPGALGWYIALAVASTGLQWLRRGKPVSTAIVSTAAKRGARVLGFAIAGLAPLAISLVVVLAAITLVAVRISGPTPARGFALQQPLRWSAPENLMGLHQVHYFTYCYAIPVLLDRPSLGGTPAVGIWFGLGWVTYLAAERLWRRVSVRRALVLGHTLAAAALVGLTFGAENPLAAAFFWILTGLGGGTVFGLTAIHRQAGRPHAALELAEDLGHVAGVLVALTALSLGLDTADLPAIGAACALATAIGVWRATRSAAPAPSLHLTTNHGRH